MAVEKHLGSEGEEALLGRSVRLIGMKMFKRGKIKAYMLELKDSQGSWFIAKRYSELLRVHNQLVSSFGGHALPPFPPKEPMLQRLLSEKRSRQEFIGERQLQLQEYLDGLLSNPATASYPPAKELLQQPPPGALLPFSGDDADSAHLPGSDLVMGRLRAHARHTGQQGCVDVILTGPVPRPDSAQITIWPADGQGQEYVFQVNLQHCGASEFEATHRLELPPGLWNIRASGMDCIGDELGSCGLSLQISAHEDAQADGPAQAADVGAGRQWRATKVSGLPVVESNKDGHRQNASPRMILKSMTLTGDSQRNIESQKLKPGSFALFDSADEAGGVGPDTSIGLRANKAPCKEKFQAAPDWAVRFR